MSIWATRLAIEDVDQWVEEMASHGIEAGVTGETSPEDHDAPIVDEGSHVLPSDTDPRGGSVDVAAIPDHITRDGRDDAPEGALKDWLRLSVSSEPSRSKYGGGPYVPGGQAVVVLTRSQVERLRHTLTEWLEREPERKAMG